MKKNQTQLNPFYFLEEKKIYLIRFSPFLGVFFHINDMMKEKKTGKKKN